MLFTSSKKHHGIHKTLVTDLLFNLAISFFSGLFCLLSNFSESMYVLKQFGWYFAYLATHSFDVKVTSFASCLSKAIFFRFWSTLSSVQHLEGFLVFAPFSFFDTLSQKMRIFKIMFCIKYKSADFLVPTSSARDNFLLVFNFCREFSLELKTQ